MSSFSGIAKTFFFEYKKEGFKRAFQFLRVEEREGTHSEVTFRSIRLKILFP